MPRCWTYVLVVGMCAWAVGCSTPKVDVSDIKPEMDPGAIDGSGPAVDVYRLSWQVEAVEGETVEGVEAVRLKVVRKRPGNAEPIYKTLDFEASDAECKEVNPSTLVPPEVAKLTCKNQVFAVGHEGDALLLYAAPVGQAQGDAFMRVGLTYHARVVVGNATEK